VCENFRKFEQFSQESLPKTNNKRNNQNNQKNNVVKTSIIQNYVNVFLRFFNHLGVEKYIVKIV